MDPSSSIFSDNESIRSLHKLSSDYEQCRRLLESLGVELNQLTERNRRLDTLVGERRQALSASRLVYAALKKTVDSHEYELESGSHRTSKLVLDLAQVARRNDQLSDQCAHLERTIAAKIKYIDNRVSIYGFMDMAVVLKYLRFVGQQMQGMRWFTSSFLRLVEKS